MREWVNEDLALCWKPAHLRLVCRTCAFNGEKYDVNAACVRLTLERLSRKRNSLLHRAETETLLLHTYGVAIPVGNEVTVKDICLVSRAVMEMYQPSLINKFSPLRTVGDGNCMYRAVSMALTGSQDNHLLLRLLTLEIVLNRPCYDTGKRDNDFIRDLRIVTSPFPELVERAMTEAAYSEMGHIFALSAAVGRPIRTCFPGNHELAKAFTRDVYGRGVADTNSHRIYLMWSSTNVPRTINAFKADHFVPLIRQDMNNCDNCDDVCVDDDVNGCSDADVCVDIGKVCVVGNVCVVVENGDDDDDEDEKDTDDCSNDVCVVENGDGDEEVEDTDDHDD